MPDPDREQLLKALQSIDPARLVECPLNQCWVMIATGKGYYDDPSLVPFIEGPFKFSARRLSLAKKAVANGNDEAPEEYDELEWLESVRMAVAGCGPGVEYYRCNLSEDWWTEGMHSYFPTLEEAKADVIERVLDLSGNITPWEDLPDDDLQDWCDQLGIEV